MSVLYHVRLIELSALYHVRLIYLDDKTTEIEQNIFTLGLRPGNSMNFTTFKDIEWTGESRLSSSYSKTFVENERIF